MLGNSHEYLEKLSEKNKPYKKVQQQRNTWYLYL